MASWRLISGLQTDERIGGLHTPALGKYEERIDVELGEMVEEIAGYPVLAGARGRPRADVDALVDAIVRLSALAIDLKDSISELDINPLFVFPAGRGVKAADALIRPKTGTRR